MWCERRSPPCGKAVARPSTRQARTQRIALDTAMPKRSAAALQERPPSTAAITRERRSWDRARVMHAGLLSSMHGESHPTAPGKDISNRSGRVVLYREMLTRMAEASGIETPTADDLVRLDRNRKNKKLSNADWESLIDPDAR